jgi:ATP-dependent 26S proteasome regulatory subunit
MHQCLKVLKPLADPDTFCTTLWRPAKGVLFYGPPGTGKTMLAKALAKESNCFFLNVTASSVMSKWFGDANRFIRGIFTLAAKLEPCVIFIGEARGGGEAVVGRQDSVAGNWGEGWDQGSGAGLGGEGWDQEVRAGRAGWGGGV